MCRHVFSLSSPSAPIPLDVLKDQHIAGLAVRLRWPDFEPQLKEYQWAYLDEVVDQAARYNKFVNLRLVCRLGLYPSWLQPIETITLPNAGLCAVPWDVEFRVAKLQAVLKVAARYANAKHVITLDLAQMNTSSNDWSMEQGTAELWQGVGYTVQKALSAAKELSDAVYAIWPRRVLLAINQVPVGLDTPRNLLVDEMVTEYRKRWKNRFILQKNSLSATTPSPDETAVLGAWQKLYDSRPYVAAQMLWFVDNDPRFRMNNGVEDDGHTILERAVQTGYHYGCQYLEIYQRDLLNPTLRQAWEWFTRELI